MAKRVLITSALPYINGVKHLGNLIGSLLPADVYARHLRLKGVETAFICGTDEHGTPAEIGAMEEGKSIEAYCLEKHELQASIYRAFDISFDFFGRSSSDENIAMTQAIFSRIDENGFVYEKSISQFYSLDDRRFLPDRYVVGTCPKCGFSSARGDQCDGCGNLLDPIELIAPRSALSGSTNLELRQTKHLFLKLEALTPDIAAFINEHPEWSPTVLGIARKWLSEGLRDRSITRDLSWGVPVNKPGFEGKVFYVWFDAPIAYISMTKEWCKLQGDADGWTRWWKDVNDVELVQFMAKDNVPFHTVFWPAMMKATGDTWVFAETIKGFNWLTYEGGKFSTSRRRGVFTDQAIALYPSDYWRYSLLASAPESDDSDFDFGTFANHVNKDLADVLGNFVNRVHGLIAKHFPEGLPPGFTPDPSLEKQVQEKVSGFLSSLDALKFRAAIQIMRSLWVLGNEYITGAQPWSIVKADRNAAANILKNCLFLQNVFSYCASPVMPSMAEHINAHPGAGDRWSYDDMFAIDWLKGTVSLPQPAVLVAKISDEEVADLQLRFAGQMVEA
ncbi:methionine--tRNA ligase [Dyella jiangningensis]|uniref:methionine--tRNA ligase n=1 Tax=Dyella jiangningensis TaxID=1379159 RepID=UPI0024108FE4|nr:methionine--tRNA ligase [Dyella jiangningensis]MDG2537791.1 methionine--tRNA ligase [Dyella jiangningensis]